MQKHNIEPLQVPNKTAQDILLSAKDGRKKTRIVEKKIPAFLEKQKEEFLQRVLSLDFDPDIVRKIVNNGVMAPDVNLVIETMGVLKQQSEKMGNESPIMPSIEVDIFNKNVLPIKPKPTVKIKQYRIGQKKEIESVRTKLKEENYKLTQKILEQKDKVEVEWASREF